MTSQPTQPPATNPAPQELTNNDLALLLDTLNPVASKCFALGLQLGVNDSRIRNIRSNNSQCEDQLREIISERLRQESPLTWHDIARALRAGSVSENRLASEIENKYIHHLPPPASVAPQANTASLATSSLTSSLQSSLPASQRDTSPLASSSVNQSDQMEITAPQPPSSVPQQERAGSSTYTSAHHSTHVLPSSQHSLHTLRTDPAQTHTSPSHATHPPLTHQFLPHPSRQPHMPIPHPAYHPPMRPPQYPTQYPTQLYPALALDGIHPLTAQPQSVQPFTSDRPSQAEWNTLHPSYMYPHHHMPPHQAPYPTSPYTRYPTIPHMSLPATNRHSLQVEADGTGWNSPLLNPHNDTLPPHTMQTHRPSGSSSLESGYPLAKRPCLEVTLQPYSQSYTQNSSSISRSTEIMLPMSTRLQHMPPFYSTQYMGDRDLPQSVRRQSPGREHYQSEEGPQRHHLQAAVTSSPILNSTSSQYSSPVNTGITPVVQQFIDYVKTIYRESEVERDAKVVKWPPTPSTVYINLACINRKSVSGKSVEYTEITEAMVRDGNVDVIHTTKGPIEFDEIAIGICMSGKHTGKERRVILVEGAPGVGKSTFAWEFCRRWERGEIAQQYQLVLLLRLRDDRISKTKSLKDLIYHSNKHVVQAVSDELTFSYNIHTLIILEGFDELPDHCRNEQSIFFQLIAGKLLPLATVLVTSRPWATERIRRNYGNRIYQHIEILGFTSQQITEYIERTLPQDKVSDLKAYLEKHPQIRMGMYIPLNSAIVVAVYQESQESGCALPTTLTELYTAMAQTLLLRCLHGHPQYETTTIKTFNDLPPAVYTKFSEVCKLAYRGIVGTSDHVQLIFTGLPSDFDSLGLMDSVTELYVTQGAVSSHNFLHLTFQEYFTAVHISILSPAEQLEHFKRHNEGRLKVVLRFLAGLTKLNTVTHEQLRGLLGEPHIEPSDECQSQYCKPMKADVCVSAYHTNWLFEAQNPDLVQSLLHNHTAAFTFTSDMLQLEYYSVGYCIAHSHSKWLLRCENINDEKLSMIVSGVETENIYHSRVALSLKTMNHMSNEKLNRLWKGFSNCIEELYLTVPKYLFLSNLSSLRILVLTMDVTSSISVLSVQGLESLTIIGTSENAVSIKSGKAISKCLSSSNSLQEFCVKGTVKHKPMEEIVKGMNDSTDLQLKRLVISATCSLSTTASRYLGKFITKTTTLQYLRICYITISAPGLILLFTAIHKCSSLQEKTIEQLEVVFDNEWSDVSTEEVRANLSQLINAHPHVVDIEESLRDLSATEENNIKASVIALSCEYCFRIYVNNNSISDAGTVALAQALHHNSTLKELYLSNNSISDAGAGALAQVLHHNSTLKELNVSNNSIGDAGAVALAQALHHNSTLKELNVSNNSIGDAGAVALAQALHHNSTLECLILYDSDGRVKRVLIN